MQKHLLLYFLKKKSYFSKSIRSGAVKIVNLLSLTKPIIVMLPARATSIPDDAGDAFDIIIGTTIPE